jgi:hypothetical protein
MLLVALLNGMVKYVSVEKVLIRRGNFLRLTRIRRNEEHTWQNGIRERGKSLFKNLEGNVVFRPVRKRRTLRSIT